MLNLWPPGWGQIWPKGYNLDTLGRGSLDKATCKFGKPGPCGKIQGDLAIFPNINPCKTCDPRGGAKFDPRAIPWALLVEAH